jgi:PAS domain S-box-containing protein
MPASPFSPENQNELIQRTLARVRSSGVWKIEVIDLQQCLSYIYMPYRQWVERPLVQNEVTETLPSHSSTPPEVWTSRPQIKPSGITFFLVIPLARNAGCRLVFHLNVSWFLSPCLKDIRSGVTGYAWLIDDRGFFLYHPDSYFIGKNAFKIREEKYPGVSFEKINFIQKEKMLRGQEGTSWYFSGWHRGITGQIKKLIAFCPVSVSTRPPQNWSVAVVAPVSEVEDALRKTSLQLFLLQGLVIGFILFGSATVLVFERRWSRLLEKKVSHRTEQLKKSEEKYRSLVESAEDFIFTVDPEGKFQSMNSFTAKFFGGSAEDFLGKHLFSLLPEAVAAKQQKLLQLVFRHGKSVREEFELPMGDQPVWISANFMPIKNENGEVSTILCIARDITESKSLERQLVNTEKLASLGTLAAGVAHEINNPLGVILGFTDILIRQSDKHSQDYEDLKTIERQGLHCKQIVENLLSFARLGSEGGEFADLNQCLEEIIKIVRHVIEMNAIILRLKLSPDISAVKGDSRQLQQVFLNLITNAVAAMQGGGQLTICTFMEKSGRKAVVQFQDTGIGIKVEDMDHIFEPFYTTKPEGQGTGLGLFISYGIITKYGGTIECISQSAAAGRPSGTTFTVKLLTKTREDGWPAKY